MHLSVRYRSSSQRLYRMRSNFSLKLGANVGTSESEAAHHPVNHPVFILNSA